MKIYTRLGDQGQTSLLGGERRGKDDPRIEAYGTVDELNSWIGLIRSMWEGGPIDHELERIQNDLFDVGAHLAAAAGSTRFPGVAQIRISALERAIDAMEEKLAPLKNFILPGGIPAAARLHVARTVCRRAERLVVALVDPAEASGTTVAYLNRLSDYFFVAARYANRQEGRKDVEWKR